MDDGRHPCVQKKQPTQNLPAPTANDFGLRTEPSHVPE